MNIQKCIENRYSMLLIVPAKFRRKLGWVKGDLVAASMNNGVLSFQKVKVTNVQYKQTESKRGPGEHVAIKGKETLR